MSFDAVVRLEIQKLMGFNDFFKLDESLKMINIERVQKDGTDILF